MVSKILLTSLTVAFLAASNQFATARVSVDRENTWYSVSGKSVGDILRAMAEHGPRDPVTGHKSWAITRWFINWRYGLKEVKGGCALSNLRTSVNIKMNLPRVAIASAAPAKLSRAWRATFNTLLDHEEVHARNGLMAAYDIDWALDTMAPAKDCKTMKKLANQRAQEIISLYQKRDRDFDIRTRNGRTTIVPLKKPQS